LDGKPVFAAQRRMRLAPEARGHRALRSRATPGAAIVTIAASRGSVGTAAVVDADDDDLVPGVVDPVQSSLGAGRTEWTPARSPRSGLPTRPGFSINEPVKNSMTAAATGSGNWFWRARTAGGVRTSS
jgi:hypothetical protein